MRLLRALVGMFLTGVVMITAPPSAYGAPSPSPAQIEHLAELWRRHDVSQELVATRAAGRSAVLEEITTRNFDGWLGIGGQNPVTGSARSWGEMIARVSVALAALDAATYAAERTAAELRLYADLVEVQYEVSPTACPPSASPEHLRGDAPSDLCERSVMSAATPQAAGAVAEIFAMLGAPYACQSVGRLGPDRFDCSSLVTIAYTRAGAVVTRPDWAPSTRDMFPWDGARLASWAVPIDPSDARPGDLALYRGETHHVVMVLADGFMAQTSTCGDVAHVNRLRPFTASRGFAGVRRVDATAVPG